MTVERERRKRGRKVHRTLSSQMGAAARPPGFI